MFWRRKGGGGGGRQGQVSPFLLVLLLLLPGQGWGLSEAMKDMISCPFKLMKCFLSKDCRDTMKCAGDCMVGQAMNLTCFVPCTYGLDQTKFFDFSTCAYNKKDPKPSDSGVLDPPLGGHCLAPTDLVDASFQLSDLSGEWYIVAGASDLEAFDCQKNRFTQINDTHWRVDEFYQGNISGVGFRQCLGAQTVTRLGPPPGICTWRTADGSSGYEATYYILTSHRHDGDGGGDGDYVISYYCAPLTPTEYGWSSLVAYSRTPTLTPEVESAMRSYMATMKWDLPLVRVNHDGCVYKLPPTPPSSSASASKMLLGGEKDEL